VCCFTATYKNKEFEHGAFFLSILAPHLTKLSKVIQAGCFDSAHVKASAELCIISSVMPLLNLSLKLIAKSLIVN